MILEGYPERWNLVLLGDAAPLLMSLTLEKGSHGLGNQTSEDEVSLAVYVESGSVY